MALFDGIKAQIAARRAHAAHVMGNKLASERKVAEAAAKHQEAALFYEEMLALGMKSPSYMMGYGMLLLRLRRYEDARNLFLKVEHCPDITKAERAQLRINFAITQWKLGNLDSSIEQFKIAQDTRVAGKSGTIYCSLGYVLIEKARQTGDFEEALAYNLEAQEYDDEDGVIQDNLGQLYLAMGDKEKALEHFTKAHELKPSQVDTLYYLAVLAKDAGDRAKAKEYLENALDGNYSALCTTTREQAQELFDTLK